MHPRPAVGLDPDQHLGSLGVFGHVTTDKLVQCGDPRDSFRRPSLGQPTPRPIHQLDIVMVLGPIISNKQHSFSRLCQVNLVLVARGRTISALMNKCSRHDGGHDIPSAINSPGYQQGHDLFSSLTGLGIRVLTHQQLPNRACPTTDR